MKREPKKVSKTVNLMTDPNPQFVSLVGAGANGTPLLVVKADDIQEIDMSTRVKTGKADIAMLAFKGEKFKDEAAVKAWLDAGNYTDVTIVKADDGGFNVPGDAEIDAPVAIEIEDGVTAFVGKSEGNEPALAANANVTAIEGKKVDEVPATGAQKNSELQPVATGDGGTKAEKGIHVNSVTLDGTAPAGTSAAGNTTPAEAHPPSTTDTGGDSDPNDIDDEGGTGDDPAKKAKGEAPAKPSDDLPKLLAKDESGKLQFVTQKAASFYTIENLADVISALSWIKQDMDYDAFFGTGDDSAKGDAIKAIMVQLGELMIAMTQEVVANVTKTEAPVAEPAVTDPLPEAAPAVAEKSAEPSLADVMKAITGLAAKVDTNTEEASKLAERLAKVEGTGQSRKSAEVEDFQPARTPAGVTKDSALRPAQKSAAEISRDVQARNALALMGG